MPDSTAGGINGRDRTDSWGQVTISYLIEENRVLNYYYRRAA
jgi:hypothetical protein